MPRSLRGATIFENLALSCVSCSLRKSARTHAVDVDTGKLEPLFNPRKQIWSAHFQMRKGVVVPLSPTGRATVSALEMNRPVIVAIRREQAQRRRRK